VNGEGEGCKTRGSIIEKEREVRVTTERKKRIRPLLGGKKKKKKGWGR